MAMRMYVWSDAPFFLAVAQASCVDEARARMLQEIGESGDGSCPIRDKAREHVKANNPIIWQGPNAEFCLSDSAECIELGALIETQAKQIRELKQELAELLRVEFEALDEKWRRETRHLSLVSEKIAHPAYLRIIAMGEPAIPLLLESLRDRPSHWFAALQAIANTDPCHIDATPAQARDAWLNWGMSRGYIDCKHV